MGTTDQFDINRLKTRVVEDKNADMPQMNSYPKYIYADNFDPKNIKNMDGDNLVIISGPIKMTKGGIPSLDGKWRNVDKDRMYFWLPNDESQEECVKFFNVLKSIDDFYDEEINVNGNKKGVLYKSVKGKDKPIKDLTYTRSVRLSPKIDNDDDDDDENANKRLPYERVKIRFSTRYDENLSKDDTADINTLLFLKDNESPENCTTVTDFDKEFTYNCTAQFAIALQKIWVQKSADKKCSITYKCVQMSILEKPKVKQNIQDQFKSNIFANIINKSQSKEKPVEKVFKKSESEDENKNEDDEEDDENPELPKVEVKKVDENDDEETDDDDDDDDDDDEDDEEEEEEEDEAPPPPPVKVKKKVEKEEPKVEKKKKKKA